ncbi:MAG: hypothetical protein Udaeo2_17120 [Candidatus Udaeobacter sp.]|nr:MAG: hypothetical protein Udaeo2_17120 [Candidatus Udaeobacter sp.]
MFATSTSSSAASCLTTFSSRQSMPPCRRMFSRTPRPSIRRAATSCKPFAKSNVPPRRARSFRLTTSPPRRRLENCRQVHAGPTSMRARGQKRRLTIRRLGQIFNRSVPCDFAQLPLENVIRFLEQVGCGGNCSARSRPIPTVCAPWPAKGARFLA